MADRSVSPISKARTMTDLLTQYLAEQRIKETRRRHRENDKRQTWTTKSTRQTFNRRFQRR